MILYMTKKVQDHFNIKDIDAHDALDHESAWHVTYETYNRRKLFTFRHLDTNFTLLMQGLRPKDIAQLETIFKSGLKETLLFAGFLPDGVDAYLKTLNKMTFLKTNNRQVIADTTKKKHDLYLYFERLDLTKTHQTIINHRINNQRSRGTKTPFDCLQESLKQPHKAVRSYKAFELNITIDAETQKVWRRVIIPAQHTLDDVHKIMQKLFGWTDSHLHEFVNLENNCTYGITEWFVDYPELKDSRTVSIEDAFKGFPRWQYIYDLGDYWVHDIFILHAVNSPKPILPLCTGATGENIPEDVGGVGGYQDYLAAIHDKTHEDHAAYQDWLSTSHYTSFDMERVNAALASNLPLSFFYR